MLKRSTEIMWPLRLPLLLLLVPGAAPELPKPPRSAPVFEWVDEARRISVAKAFVSSPPRLVNFILAVQIRVISDCHPSERKKIEPMAGQ
jgi:hypothetical protein